MDLKKIGFGASVIMNAILVAAAGALVTLLFSLQQKVADLEASDLSQWGNMADMEKAINSEMDTIEIRVQANSIDTGVKQEMLDIIKSLLNPNSVGQARFQLQDAPNMLKAEPEALRAETAEPIEEQMTEETIQQMEQQTEPVTGEELDRYIQSRKNQSRK